MFVVLFLLTACAPSTVKALKDDPSGRISFDVPLNYQGVYRTVLERAQTCYTSGLITAYTTAQGNLYSDIKEGDVSIETHGGLGISVYAAINIKSVSENETRVTTFYASSTWKNTPDIVANWIKNNSNECSVQVDRQESISLPQADH